jgi:hypothetical protein
MDLQLSKMLLAGLDEERQTLVHPPNHLMLRKWKKRRMTPLLFSPTIFLRVISNSHFPDVVYRWDVRYYISTRVHRYLARCYTCRGLQPKINPEYTIDDKLSA